MAGSKSKGSKIASDSAAIAKKIVIHSKADSCGDKFLKYMQHVNLLKKNASTSSNRSPWLELRTYGALEAIMMSLKKIFALENIQELLVCKAGTKPVSNQEANNGNRKIKDVCNVALSILSNAFALDYSARSEAVKNGFIASLKQFIADLTVDHIVAFKTTEILARAVKCTANLSNDPHCRESVLKTGVAISVLRILELADEKMQTTCNRNIGDESFVDKAEIRYLICACVRAVRIFSSDCKLSNGRDHLLRFGGLVTIISVISWEAELASDEDIILDVIRALTFLSLRIRSANLGIVEKLIHNPESGKIRVLVKLFKTSQPDGKLYLPLIKCLINLSANKEISDCLGELRIFQCILEKLNNYDECYYKDLIKLLVALTKYSSFNQSHLTTSPLIGSTLKILKSSSFKEYHEWLLMVYEKLYEGSLSKLIQCGLVNQLCDILRQGLEDCDYGSLRRKITSLDDGKCSVHQDQEHCPFTPTYRCSSPSYQKIQEEMKQKATITEDMDVTVVKGGDDSLSPLSSPAHSWASGGSSPQYSDFSHASYSSFSEDDRFQNSKTNLFFSTSSSPEPTVIPEVSDNPAAKKRKLEDGKNSSEEENDNSEISKATVKRIVGVLNILHKCTYIKPFPSAVLQIAPVLLGIILRGKVSMMPQRVDYQSVDYDDDLRELSRRTFEVSYKIILNMCSTIQIFSEIILSGLIPVLYRLQEPISVGDNDEHIATVQKYCSNIISATVGVENNTAGYREGFIMRSLLVNDSSEKIDQLIVNIPLLYQRHVPTLRKFESTAKSWSKILEMLINSDDISYYQFEDCTLALCSLCVALGIKWTSLDANDNLRVLFPSPRDISHIITIVSKDDVTTSLPDEDRVKLTLDDGTIFTVKKDMLVQASPFFSAMFNGHFIEAGQQKVHLPNVSKAAVLLLVDQIFMLSNSTETSVHHKVSHINQYELSTIFELFNLADRFLLEDVYERALNTVMSQYICPYSAPIIYAESVKLVSLQKSGECGQTLGETGLNFFVLKYILAAKNIKMSERCNAIRKIFDFVIPSHVVEDLRALIEGNMYKS